MPTPRPGAYCQLLREKMAIFYKKGNEKLMPDRCQMAQGLPLAVPSPGVINDSDFFTSKRKKWIRNLAMTQNNRG